MRHPTDIADEMEAVAQRGHNSDREHDHSQGDELLLELLLLLADRHEHQHAVQRAVDAWRAGSQHWWWA